MEAGKRCKKRWGPFFFFFFLLFTFENDENLFWVYQKGNFLPGKRISRREKNQEKWLCPLRKICLLRPARHPMNGRNRQLTRRKSMKQVWNNIIMTQYSNSLTQVWNWNRFSGQGHFWDETELLFEWKMFEKVWKKTYIVIITNVNLCDFFQKQIMT